MALTTEVSPRNSRYGPSVAVAKFTSTMMVMKAAKGTKHQREMGGKNTPGRWPKVVER